MTEQTQHAPPDDQLAEEWGDDILFYLPDVPFEEADPGPIDTYHAERNLEVVRALEDELARDEEHAAQEARRITEWLARRRERAEKALSWRRYQLHLLLKKEGLKTMNLVNGTLKSRAGRAAVVVEDEEAFLAWVEKQDEALRERLTNTKVIVKPDKKELKKHLEATMGDDIVAGVDIVQGDPTFKAEPKRDAPPVDPRAGLLIDLQERLARLEATEEPSEEM